MRLPWQKKSSDASADVPEEVREYYEAGKRERKSVAWLLAFVTLVVTVLVVFGAFLGGRWVYRKIADQGEPANVTTQDEDSNRTEEGSEPSSSTEEQSSGESSENAGEEPTPAPAPDTPVASPGAPSGQSAPPSQSNNLAETGPGDTAAIFAIATVAGTVLYQIKLRRQNR